MPVQPAIRREPLSPPPAWRSVFLEPAYPDQTDPNEDDDRAEDDDPIYPGPITRL